MLQSFRENIKGVTAFILVGLLIIPFAFFGVESLFVAGSSVEQVATVNGEKITQLELERGIEFQKQRMLSQFENLDPALLDDNQMRGPVLDQLVRQKLLAMAARDQGMAVSNDTFNEIILSTEAFRQNGQFDSALYEYHLGRLGFTPLGYRENVKTEVLVSHLVAGLQSTGFATKAQQEDFARLAMQERSFDYVTLSQREVDDVVVSEEEISAYYEENQGELMEPDRVVVDYIELTPALLEPALEISEEQVDEKLAQSRELAGDGVTTWQLAHILLEAGDDASATVIGERLAEGEAFDSLAREFSTDFGSAEQGGELGTFTTDALPPGFGDAIADLEAGEVAGPVELESGIHFIKVLGVSRVDAESLMMTREEAEAELRSDLAREQLLVVLERLKEETFSVDSLQPVGESLGLPVSTSRPFTREGGDGIARYPAVVEAAYSPDVLDEGFASEVLELGENQFLVLKLREFIPSHLPPREEVADSIRETLSVRKAQAAVQARAGRFLARLEGGETLADVAAQEDLEIKSLEGVTRFDQRIPPDLGNGVFALTGAEELPQPGMATSLNGDVTLFVVNAIKPGSVENLSAEEGRAIGLSLAQLGGNREFSAYLEGLVDRADIKGATANDGE